MLRDVRSYLRVPNYNGRSTSRGKVTRMAVNLRSEISCVLCTYVSNLLHLLKRSRRLVWIVIPCATTWQVSYWTKVPHTYFYWLQIPLEIGCLPTTSTECWSLIGAARGTYDITASLNSSGRQNTRPLTNSMSSTTLIPWPLLAIGSTDGNRMTVSLFPSLYASIQLSSI